MPAIVGNILSVVIAILILLLTITVHELGHYVVGKILKFNITEFAIGMGPAIFKRTLKNGEIFSIRIFPLGGYCAFEGEDEDTASRQKIDDNRLIGAQTEVFEGNTEPIEEEKKKPLSPNAFNNKKPWMRILVLLAGATMNFIFAVLLITVKFVGYGHFQIRPTEIIPGAMVGDTLQAGDIITSINDNYVYLTTDYVNNLNGKKKGDLVKIGVISGGEKKEVTVSLQADVDCKSLSDVEPCFKALGFGSVVTIGTFGDCPIENGAYLFRFADFEDEEHYKDCERIFTLDDLYSRLSILNAGETLKVWVYKDGYEERKLVTLTAPGDYDSVDKSSYKSVLAAFGIESEPLNISYQASSTSVKLGFFEALYRAPAYGFKSLGATAQSLWQLVTGKLSISSVSGPIGTVTLTSTYVSYWRMDYILEIAALIGISIAIFNVLPIPALDGARVVFVIIEWIRKKPVNRNVEGAIHFAGLIALVIFAVSIDVIKLFI